MAIRDIVKHPNPILREQSSDISTFDEKLQARVTDMIETMHHANGIGLAAVQIGNTERLLVIDIAGMAQGEGEDNEDEEEAEADPEVYINPILLESSGETEYEEGCLSIPGVYGTVKRAAEIKLRYMDLEGDTYEEEMDGIRAIVIQHELDHLNGVLFLDHLGAMKRSLLLSKYNKLQQEKDED